MLGTRTFESFLETASFIGRLPRIILPLALETDIGVGNKVWVALRVFMLATIAMIAMVPIIPGIVLLMSFPTTISLALVGIFFIWRWILRGV